MRTIVKRSRDTELRQTVALSTRDVDALSFVGEGFEVLQYQLHEAVFPGLSEAVVSRFVRRWERRGVLLITRLNKLGPNRLRLAAAGRALLEKRGVDGRHLFAPRSPVALKDLAHTAWINDLRVLLRFVPRPFDAVLPAWGLQRQLVPPTAAIPDVLAVRTPRIGAIGFVLACEVDLGAERVKSVFVPKLIKLRHVLVGWSEESSTMLLVLTRGSRRAGLLREAVLAIDMPIVVEELPAEGGRQGLHELRKRFQMAF
jgi:hypothetical protein